MILNNSSCFVNNQIKINEKKNHIFVTVRKMCSVVVKNGMSLEFVHFGSNTIAMFTTDYDTSRVLGIVHEFSPMFLA